MFILYPHIYRDSSGQRWWRIVFEKDRFTLYVWVNDRQQLCDFQLSLDNMAVMRPGAQGWNFSKCTPPDISDVENYHSDSKLLLDHASSAEKQMLLEALAICKCEQFSHLLEQIKGADLEEILPVSLTAADVVLLRRLQVAS